MIKESVPDAPGIYVARILSDTPIPVTRDPQYIETCARVDKLNIRVGKASNLSDRQRDYWKDFGEENVEFIPVAILQDIQPAESAILRHFEGHRKCSPQGAPMNWLENIDTEPAIKEICKVLKAEGLEHSVIKDSSFFRMTYVVNRPLRGSVDHFLSTMGYLLAYSCYSFLACVSLWTSYLLWQSDGNGQVLGLLVFFYLGVPTAITLIGGLMFSFRAPRDSKLKWLARLTLTIIVLPFLLPWVGSAIAFLLYSAICYTIVISVVARRISGHSDGSLSL